MQAHPGSLHVTGQKIGEEYSWKRKLCLKYLSSWRKSWWCAREWISGETKISREGILALPKSIHRKWRLYSWTKGLCDKSPLVVLRNEAGKWPGASLCRVPVSLFSEETPIWWAAAHPPSLGGIGTCILSAGCLDWATWAWSRTVLDT